IKSVIGTTEFNEAVHRIVNTPVTTWTEISEDIDIRQARRFSNNNVKKLIKRGNRTAIPESHFLNNYGLATLPERIHSARKTDSLDTPENRFIKYALETFLKFCIDINHAADGGSKLDKESSMLINELELQLHHTFFKEIS